MLERIGTELASAGPAEKAYLRQQTKLIRGLLTSRGSLPRCDRERGLLLGSRFSGDGSLTVAAVAQAPWDQFRICAGAIVN
jgi:hypothetical protein